MEMEMENSKSSEPQDRLSELPDSLIFSIFEFLPMKDVVRTQILSHRWENLWTLTPYLYFLNDSTNSDVFHNLVNRCLLRWKGTRVQKFKVQGCEFKNSLYSDVDLWVRFAVDNCVEELDIYYQAVCSAEDDHFVPQCVYSCSSLRKLELRGVNMDVRGNVEWNKLESLIIEGYKVTGHAIKQILRGSPLLKVFMVYLGETEKNSKLCFRSSSLKQLNICRVPRAHDYINSELEIWTPNLETMTISGIPYGKCLLKNVSSVTQLTLLFYGVRSEIPATVYDFIGRTLNQILPTIQHVKTLTLSHWCIKVLGDRKSKGLLSPLSNIKFLTLSGSFNEHERIVDLLEVFPKLKILVVVEEKVAHSDAPSSSKLKFEPNPSESFLEELMVVDVTCTKHDLSMFPLIKSLLKYASNLEKMMLRVKGILPPSHPSVNPLFKVTQELLRMPRSSPTSKLIICD